MPDQDHAIVSYRVFIRVWLLLIVLTAITVGVSRIPLGVLNIWVALGIASLKSSLVIFFFMHLKNECRIFKVFLLMVLVTLALFIGLTFFDVLYR